MRKIVNTAHIEGRVHSHKLALRKVQDEKSKNFGTEFIGGTLDIATDEAGTNIVQIHYTYVVPTYKNGNENKSYKALKEIIDKGKTIEKDGFAAATCISCSPSIAINDFWVEREGKEELVSAKRLEGGFVNLISSTKLNKDENARNTFEVDMLINNVRHIEENETTKEPEYLMIEGFTWAFNGAILPVGFAVKSKPGMKYFENCDISKDNRLFTKVWGNLKNTTVTVQKNSDDEAAFGEIQVREYTRNNRTWEVSSASKNNYEIGDEENGVTLEEIKKCLQDREVYLADQKKRSDDYKASKGTKVNNNQEFDF